MWVALFLCLPLQGKDERGALPILAEGFEARIFAREPQIRNPASMAFDARGRLFVGQGPQFRHPKPDTPGDRVLILIDSDGDGICDRTRTFAAGLNCIQGLAWKGRDLWIANAPDLTVVRDLDGDDEADEYLLIYTDLGNLEHGLHGLNWGPDGKLYMSKGNSKGLTRPGRIAPKPFRDLWGSKAPPGSPDLPPIVRYTKGTYQKRYHNPADDWGREGGVLRCDDMGRNLEIVSRGFRNPWDIAFDDGFDWLGTDNDQREGDRIFMPFFGGHFGWGHPWSYHWTGEGHLPSAPISGPVFHGSGTGVVYSASESFPPEYRNVFFINDWLSRSILVYRPTWKGALLLPDGGRLETLAHAGRGRSLGGSGGRVFDPTDLEVGPDGALWVLSWGHGYGAQWKDGKQTNEGRVYRILHRETPLVPRAAWDTAKRRKPGADWTFEELLEDLRHDRLPVWRTNAQEELVRRGAPAAKRLLESLDSNTLAKGRETWVAWTLGRIAPGDGSIDAFFGRKAANRAKSLNLRLQAIRILAHRIRRGARPAALTASAGALLRDPEPRIRFETVQAVWQAGLSQLAGTLENAVAEETDRLTYYAAWMAMGDLTGAAGLRSLLPDPRAGVRRAALLGLLQSGALKPDEVTSLAGDPDPATAAVASLWLSKVGRGKAALSITPPGGVFSGPVTISLESRLKGVTLKYTLDGSVPTDSSPTYRRSLTLDRDATVRAAILRDRVAVGPIVTARFRIRREAGTIAPTGAVAARSARAYALSRTGLREGEPAYTDRRYTFTEVPEELRSLAYVLTSNGDAGSRGPGFLTLRLAGGATVFLAHDVRMARKPAWMKVGADGGFEPTDLHLATTDTRFRVYRKEFPVGLADLGGNTDDGVDSGRSNYIVVIKEHAIAPRKTPTTMAEAMAVVAKGDPLRGRALFFSDRGAGCHKCHRVGGLGNPFAPDLSDIGSRTDARTLLESMLAPGAAITEGYNSLHIRTRDGTDHVGFLIEETGLGVKLVTAEGKEVSIRKDEIAGRRRLKESAMPGNYARLLGPRQLADLVAWMSTLRKQEGKLGFRKVEGAIKVEFGGRPVATYVYADKRIRRPYFAHARAPDGTQVTRNHPPVKGKDATDHATMHPGIWMAFGDLGGADFWRNRADVVREEYSEHPDGFTVVNRWDDGGRAVCKESCRYTFKARPGGTLLIIDARFHLKDGEFAFGDQEEMGLGVRVATPLAVRSGGRILDAKGRVNEKQIWGNASEWCEYSGTLEGRKAGILIMPDPENFRPSWFHSRDYGVLVANPFGRKAFRKGPPSRVEVGKGKPFRLRFGVLLFTGARDPKDEYSAFLRILPDLARP